MLQRTLYYFVQAARKSPETDWFVSDFLHVDDELRYIIGDDYYGWNFKDAKAVLTAIFEGNHFIQSNVFFKKKLFTDVGGFDESMRMSEDLDLYIRFLLRGSMPQYLSFISHLHRFHTSNLSKDIDVKKHLTHVEGLRNKYAQQLTEQGI